MPALDGQLEYFSTSGMTDNIGSHQGHIKRKRHATPNTLPIDIKILDVTKNSASGCSREYIIIYKRW